MRHAFAFDCETMIHGSNFDLAGRIIHDGMICSMMPVRHFYRSAAEREPQELMAETDAKQGYPRVDDLLDHG
jgi:hypothetical protein